MVELVQQALEVLRGYGEQYIASPNRDILTFVFIGTVAFVRWYAGNVSWNPAHIGAWTRKAWGESAIDDKSIKLLCSVAPFIADVVASPVQVLRGLSLNPTLKEKVEDLEAELAEALLTSSNQKRRLENRMDDFHLGLQDTLLGLSFQKEKTQIDLPLRIREVEEKLFTLKSRLQATQSEIASSRKDVAKLEDAYVVSLDTTVAKLVAEALSRREEPALAVESSDFTLDCGLQPEELYMEVLKEHDRRESVHRSGRIGGQAGC